MSKPIILVTGATGTVGTQVAQTLLQAGARVRVGVRNPERARELADAGAEVVSFDWDDPDSYATTFRGIGRVFLLTPFVERPDHYVRNALAAAKAAGVEHIVRMSAIGADSDPEHGHGLAEVLVKQSGLGFTILQPTFFADNPVNYQGESLRSDGSFYGASHGGRITYVASRDIAEVAAAALLDPGAHAGQTYVLTGTEALTDSELAAILGDIAGRPIAYVDLSGEQWGEGLRGQGVPEWMVEHMVSFEAIKAQGWASAVSDHVQTVLGRAPTSVREGLARYAGGL